MVTKIVSWKDISVKNMAKLFFSHKNSLMILILFYFFRSFAHIYIYKRFFRSAVLNVHTILTAITAFHLGCFQTSCIIYKKNVSRCKWSCLFLSLCSHLESMLKWGRKNDVNRRSSVGLPTAPDVPISVDGYIENHHQKKKLKHFLFRFAEFGSFNNSN